jgi:hypothetical protein
MECTSSLKSKLRRKTIYKKGEGIGCGHWTSSPSLSLHCLHSLQDAVAKIPMCGDNASVMRRPQQKPNAKGKNSNVMRWGGECKRLMRWGGECKRLMPLKLFIVFVGVSMYFRMFLMLT